jgi:hypothetical protein
VDTRLCKGEVTNGTVKRLISSVKYSVHLYIMYLKKNKTVYQKGQKQLRSSSPVWIFQICVLKFGHVLKVRSHFLQKYCCNYVCDFHRSCEVYSKRKYICTLMTYKGFFLWILMWLFRTPLCFLNFPVHGTICFHLVHIIVPTCVFKSEYLN